ncbi:MAG: hypothetical protein EZS28_036260 [Streblomastix strix]|uniref:Right handed beta helix domain-containing protein n=1 Tax=Streblomastix strix TaxID=222440 RepID=A0A5J4UDE6_9EUKA|nr:MAG: hypothetical protein EZS28_036260 [Streblomastix strix]
MPPPTAKIFQKNKTPAFQAKKLLQIAMAFLRKVSNKLYRQKRDPQRRGNLIGGLELKEHQSVSLRLLERILFFQLILQRQPIQERALWAGGLGHSLIGIDNPIGMPADKDSAKAADYPSVKIDNVFILNTYSSHGEPNSDDRALIYGYFKKLDIINSTFENNYRYRIDYSLKGTVLGIFGMKEDASITNSTFQNNILDAGDFDIAHNAGGAAIYYRATGNLKIKNSHFIKNRIYGVDLSNMNTGGAINFKGTGAALEIEGSDFDGNVASPAGAIFYSGPLLKITDSVFSRNIALSAGYDDREEGAAIYTQAKNTIINNSVFSANSGSLGIIYNESGDLTIGNSLFQNNISPLSKQGNAIYSKKGQITITSNRFWRPYFARHARY